MALTCTSAVMAQENKWSLTPKAGMTVATLAGEDAEYCSNGVVLSFFVVCWMLMANLLVLSMALCGSKSMS